MHPASTLTSKVTKHVVTTYCGPSTLCATSSAHTTSIHKTAPHSTYQPPHTSPHFSSETHTNIASKVAKSSWDSYTAQYHKTWKETSSHHTSTAHRSVPSKDFNDDDDDEPRYNATSRGWPYTWHTTSSHHASSSHHTSSSYHKSSTHVNLEHYATYPIPSVTHKATATKAITHTSVSHDSKPTSSASAAPNTTDGGLVYFKGEGAVAKNRYLAFMCALGLGGMAVANML